MTTYRFAILVLLFAAITQSTRADEERSIPTWERDITPIFLEHCVSCHRPGAIAPMSMTTHAETRPWAKSIRKLVADGSMPPWHAQKGYGPFLNDRSLDEDVIDTIVRWVDVGAPEGESLPRLDISRYEHPSGWEIGAPDLIMTVPEAFQVPAKDLNEYLYMDIGVFPEDRWVTAIEFKADNRRVTHHLNLYAEQPPKPGRKKGRREIVAMSDPRQNVIRYPEGTAVLYRKGTTLSFEGHFTPTGQPETASPSIGFIFAREPIAKEFRSALVGNYIFTIPAGADNHLLKANWFFKDEITVLGLIPHMHLRGKAFTYTVEHPGGQRELLLEVPEYDFDWQTYYEFETPRRWKRGTKVEVIGYMDNSADNPDNPDPTRPVSFGLQTHQEMMIGYIAYTLDDEDLIPGTGSEYLVPR